MKLQDRLPDGVVVNGKHYKADFDFRNVLRMIGVLETKDLLPEARTFLALRCIMKRPPKNGAQVLRAVVDLVAPSDTKTGEKTTDFEQDADMIRAAFLQSYNIDLWEEKLHWMKFISLLKCLPDGSRYADIISIRVRPVPTATKYNSEERKWLIRAKAEYGIKMTEEEKQKRLSANIKQIASGLMAIAEKGGGTDGV